MTRTLSAAAFAKILQNSYRNFHAKDIDYVCLLRTPSITLKFYFFDSTDPNQVASPHTNRYNFTGNVIRGQVTNAIWEEGSGALSTPSERFRFYSPMVGGSGFVYDGPCDVRVDRADVIGPGGQFSSTREEIHSLTGVMPGTVLFTQQGPSYKRPNQSTWIYLPAKLDRRGDAIIKPPSLDGLYAKFKATQLWERLYQLETISPGALSWVRE